MGIGSRDTYCKEKFIVENQSNLTSEDFADWDEGKLSTNKAYQKIKQQLQEKDNQIAGYELKLQKVKQLESEISELKIKLAEKPKEVNHKII